MATILMQTDVAELLATYRETGSVKRTARIMGISEYRVRRTLIAAGIRGAYAEAIAADLERGYSVEEIAHMRGVSVKAIQAHLPYTKGAYCVEPKEE